MNRKIKFQEGGRATPYNPVGHLTNPEEAKRQRIAGNKAARKRMPTKEQENYWWSGLTRPVDEVLRKSLGPAASSVQGVLDLFTPARSIAEVSNKPTAGNMINAATDTALTAGGLKAVLTPAKVAQKVNRTIPTPLGGKDMSKINVAKNLIGKAADALKPKKTPKTATSPTSAPMPKPAPRPKVNKPPKKTPKSNNSKNTGTPSADDMVRKAADKEFKRAAAKQAASKQPDKAKDIADQKKIAANIKANRGGAGKPPAVRKTTSPTVAPKSKVPAVAPKSKVPAVAPKSKVPANRQPGFNLTSPKGKGSNLKKLIGPALATGAGAYLLSSEKNAKPSAGSQAGGTSVNTSPDGSNAGMDADLFDTPTGVTGRKPTGTTGRKPKPDDGYKFYGKEGTGLGDFSRKHGMQYATQKQFEKDFNMDDGEKAGGRPGRGKLKTQGMNKAGKRKAGFSGRGSGAALRGF